jgi:hypothetical protein
MRSLLLIIVLIEFSECSRRHLTRKTWPEDAGVRSQEVVVSENGDVRVNVEIAKR